MSTRTPFSSLRNSNSLSPNSTRLATLVTEVQVIPLPYNPEDYEDSKPFEDGDLPCKAFKEHIRADTKDVAPKRKWMYHYNQTTFSSGTHYVFLESDTEAFPLHAFGPTGYVHAHGGTLSYQRLRSRISQGRPLVMLHQTGGVSQAFGSLHKSIGHMSADSMKSTDQILAEIDLFSSEKWAAGFGVPEIMMFKELLSRGDKLRGAKRRAVNTTITVGIRLHQ